MNCPGSLAACVGIHSESSVFSREGTYAHDIAAKALEGEHPATDYIGETDGEFIVDAEMAAHIQEYLDVVEELRLYADDIYFEKKVRLHTIRKDCWGTADAIVFSGEVLDVIDLKFGAGKWADVIDNPQLKIYALGALLTYLGRSFPVKRVRMHIVQPRHHKGGHSVYEMSKEDLFQWGRVDLALAAEATDKPDAPFVPGDWCHFCDVKPTCPKLREVATERTKHLFADEGMKTPAKTPPSPNEMTPEQISEALAAFPLIEAWIGAVRSHAHDEATHGRPIPGRKLVQKIGNRAWTDEEEAQECLELFDVHPFAEPKLLSPAQAEKKLKKDQKAIIGKLVHRPQTGMLLVEDSDKRPAIPSGDVFGSLPKT